MADRQVELVSNLVKLAVVVLVSLFFVVGWLVRKLGSKKWKVLALEMDLKYLAEDHLLDRKFPELKFFSLGDYRQASHVLFGDMRGAKVTVADYTYVTGFGRNRWPHNQTIVVISSPGVAFPHSVLRRQRFYDFIGKIFGGQDIDFEEDPEFSKAFVLQGMQPTATWGLFNQEVRRRFLRFKNRPIHFECNGNTMLLHFGRLLKPGKIPKLIHEAFFLHDGLILAVENLHSQDQKKLDYPEEENF